MRHLYGALPEILPGVCPPRSGGALPRHWVGVDLNSTGHLAVLAEPATGFVLRLGQTGSLFADRPGGHAGPCGGRPYARLRSKLRAMEKAVCLAVSREIVRVARRLACGIKFERLFSRRIPRGRRGPVNAFLRVQEMVEARARRAGVPVRYVDPASTSKRCHRCGAAGRRHRKRFECPVCGLVAHADVNAAINIAGAPCRSPPGPQSSPSQRSLLRRARDVAGAPLPPEGLLAFFDGLPCRDDGPPPRPSPARDAGPFRPATEDRIPG